MYRYAKTLFCYALVTIILIVSLCYGATYKTEYIPEFWFSTNEVIIQTTAYKDTDSTFYLFLPSHITLADLKISLPENHSVFIGETEMHDDMSCANFDWDIEYALNIDGTYSSIRFLCSENTPSLYINTSTGTMDRIHQDKNYQESATILLISDEGKIEYQDKNGNIKGRGNATWRYDKKPYVLTFSEESAILDMGKSSKWILLANALDDSNLRNKLAMDIAQEIGFEWSPQCKYVELYLNGNYNGLYLISEKIEIGLEQLNLDTEDGDFLCTIDFERRWDTMTFPFLTNSGRAVEISALEQLSAKNEANIHSAVNELESIIFSSNDLNQNPKFDLDSWACRYLLDEIFCNLDSDVTSSYFYRKDNVFYAGPIWDYDMSLGITFPIRNPEALYANLSIKYSGNRSTYYSSLYNNPSFLNRVRELYETKFSPLLNAYIYGYIDDLSSCIEKSSKMNRIRWQSVYEYARSIPVILPSSEDTSPKNFLTKRIEFLDRVFIDNEEFVSVQFNVFSWNDWHTFSVKKGEMLENTPTAANGFWVLANSNERFDPTIPITENLIIEFKSEPSDEYTDYSSSTRSSQELIVIVPVLMLLTFFLIFASIEIKYRKNGGANEKQR